MINTRWLFVLSCIALVTSAFTFSLHGDVMQEMGKAFNFSQEQNGSIGKGIFWGMAAAMLVGGFVCDFLGVKRVMFLALLSHVVGSLGMVFTHRIVGTDDPRAAFNCLWFFAFLMGCGNGWTEVGINPLVATLYSRDKTHYLNILHAWWPGGLIIGGLLAVALRTYVFTGADPSFRLFGQFQHWQTCLLLIPIPAVVYGLMLIPSVFPATERVQSGVSTGTMLMEALRPAFLLWAFCMLLTAATELGPQKWQNSVMQSTLNIPGAGTLILVYTSGLMFVMRHFAGPIAHKISPVGLLLVSSALSGIGLYLLSFAHDATTAFTYATIYGFGIAYFWPTMLGVAAERFPKGGALILALMGTAGNISIGFALDQMGRIVDTYSVAYVQQNDPQLSDKILMDRDGKPIAVDESKVKELPKDGQAYEVAQAAKQEGFRMAFRWVSLLPVVLVVLFGAVMIGDYFRGGYKPEHLEAEGGGMSG